MIEVRRRTILADARSRAGGVRVRVGLGALDAAAAAAASEVPGGAPSAEQVMATLGAAVACLKKDVAVDACSDWYGPECSGSDPEVDVVAECLTRIEKATPGTLTPVTWQDALTCAGVEATEENKTKFAACVLKRETSWHSVPRGTLAYCALQVRRGIEGGEASLAHSTLEWRNGFETWANAFDVFRQKWETASAGEVGFYGSAAGIPMSEVARYAASYNAFRRQFIDAGGSTSCEEIKTPGASWVWWAVGGALVLVVASVVLWQVKTVASLATQARAA